MCPEFERAQRVVQNAVDRTEKVPYLQDMNKLDES